MRALREANGRDASLGRLGRSARGSRARSDSLEGPRAAFAAPAGRGGSLEARSCARGDQSGATRNGCSSMSARQGTKDSGWQAKQPPSDPACSRPIKSLMAGDGISGGPQAIVLSGSGERRREKGTSVEVLEVRSRGTEPPGRSQEEQDQVARFARADASPEAASCVSLREEERVNALYL